jgi:hypothetical protein
MIRHRSWLFLLLIGFTPSSLVSNNKANAAPLITTALVSNNVTDYSSSGLNLGTYGYWFANFGAKAPAKLAPVDQDDANALPSWVQVNFDPKSAGYSFALSSPSSAFSNGGIAGYNSLTLPNGATGLSGQLVDDINATSTQSNQLIKSWVFGPGAPSSAYVSIVLDNAPLGELTVVQRLRLTNSSADAKAQPTATYDNLAAGANGTADVYTFRLDNIEVGGFLAIQLRTTGAPGGADTGLAGVLFSPVPEPASFVSLAVGAALLGFVGVRRRKTSAKGRCDSIPGVSTAVQ